MSLSHVLCPRVIDPSEPYRSKPSHSVSLPYFFKYHRSPPKQNKKKKKKKEASILYVLASAALLLPFTMAGVVPSELVVRVCRKRPFDLKGILCGMSSGLWPLSPVLFLSVFIYLFLSFCLSVFRSTIILHSVNPIICTPAILPCLRYQSMKPVQRILLTQKSLK